MQISQREFEQQQKSQSPLIRWEQNRLNPYIYYRVPEFTVADRQWLVAAAQQISNQKRTPHWAVCPPHDRAVRTLANCEANTGWSPEQCALLRESLLVGVPETCLASPTVAAEGPSANQLRPLSPRWVRRALLPENQAKSSEEDLQLDFPQSKLVPIGPASSSRDYWFALLPTDTSQQRSQQEDDDDQPENVQNERLPATLSDLEYANQLNALGIRSDQTTNIYCGSEADLQFAGIVAGGYNYEVCSRDPDTSGAIRQAAGQLVDLRRTLSHEGRNLAIELYERAREADEASKLGAPQGVMSDLAGRIRQQRANLTRSMQSLQRLAAA